MSKYEYTIMIADEVIDTRKSNREYEYAIACMRGPKWRAGKFKQAEDELAKLGAKLANPALTPREIAAYQDLATRIGIRYVDMKGWKDDWFVAGYCGNMALALKAQAKELRFIGDWGWDEVRIQPVLKREIKKRA
jgi:hypothetical protein